MPPRPFPPTRVTTLSDEELKAAFHTARLRGNDAARHCFDMLDKVTEGDHTFARGCCGGAYIFVSNLRLAEKRRLYRLGLLRWAPSGRYATRLRFDKPDDQSHQVAVAAASAAADHLSATLGAPFEVCGYID